MSSNPHENAKETVYEVSKRAEIVNNLVCECGNRKRFDEVDMLFISGRPH
jgi:hypothetical protein